MAIAFIKTDKTRWDLAENFDDMKDSPCGIPGYAQGKPIPVISCIGSSRDGKSTLLNNLYKYYSTQSEKAGSPKKTDKPVYPFKSKSGDDVTTNGIDFIDIPGECILMDCQGMALKDAKYDHYLTLMVYQLSDVIILNVRQRLDLQVLNNLLAVFSFLSEIPPESRRPDKPTLVIRIKDFQDFEALEENSEYLNEYVKRWLEKSGDQYDQIKEAFSMAFNIDIVYTEYPKFPPKKSALDLYHKDFEKDNPSFLEACTYIMKIAQSRGTKKNKLLANNAEVRELINTLKNNSKIDYRKLDLYHNITKTELLEYLRDVVNKPPYNDISILSQMDGSLGAYNLYQKKMIDIKDLKHKTYNSKFKDVTLDVKEEVFKKQFDEYFEFCAECKKKNIRLAEALIKPHIDEFNQKFIEGSNPFSDLVNKISNIFTDKRKKLEGELDKIDKNVKESWLRKLDEEKAMLKKIQQDIIAKNNANIKALEDAIRLYSPDMHNQKYTLEELDKQFGGKNYNVQSSQTYETVKSRIRSDLQQIYEKHKRTYFIGADKTISEKKTLDFDLERFIPKEDPYFCWSHKGHRLSDMVFLHNVALDNNMDLVKLYYSPDKCIMFTSVSFTDFYRDQHVQKYFKDYGFLYENLSAFNDVIKIVEDGVGSKKSCKNFGNDDYRKLITDKPALTKVTLKFDNRWSVPQEMINLVKDKLFEAVIAYIREHPKRSDIVFVTSS
ncbi:putative hydrolase [Yasminevirus sp. GU-2018]|uniref:Putative hydrolase n=1 Tax=Yasminevirus sp. GU-2018 TaxID=2420051 RepID=A0A5K0U9P4_9VIRU|nr:putative hydrolase [Yasminevirus sp. GU-2018]